MKKINSIIILTLLITISSSSWGQKIVYPWRSSTAIVKSGENFEVWYNADSGQIVNSVELKGPYNTVNATIDNTLNQTWVYDQWSGNTCNQKLSINVPSGTPADRYDLILKTSTGDEISLAAVKVIKEYKSSYYIMHISDVHRWQGTYDTPNIILREVSTIIDIANIINPAMLIETGDSYYPNANNASSTEQRIVEFMTGFTNTTANQYVNGMNNSYAPVFIIPGNHDTNLKNYELEPGYPNPGYETKPAQDWNRNFGLGAQNFIYGNTRFMGVNNSWTPDTGGGAAGYVPNYKWQLDAANTWMNTVGKGTFRIAFFHVPQESVPPVYNSFKAAGNSLDLMLAGHVHSITYSPFIYDSKNIYTTLTPRDGTKKAPFNLYKIDEATGTYQTIGNAQAANQGLETAQNYNTSNLKLTYSNLNNGTNSTNTATIVNKFSFPIAGARVRFVVPKGQSYYVLNATITQEFDGTDFHIIDASYNLTPNSTYVVNLKEGVQVDECPNDPNKMEPGFCGCGVAEGTCDIHATGVSITPATAKINIFTTRQLTANILPSNTTNKNIIWDSNDTSVATVNSTGIVTAVAAGTTTISATTVNGGKTATSSITVIPDTTTYQAEDAEFSGPIVATNQTGYRGTGFLDYTNATADYITWTVFVNTDGSYNLGFRYALASGNRPLKLTINGQVIIASIAFPVTGSYSTWGTYTTSQLLKAGNNTITLTAIGSSGGNFDELSVTSPLGVNDKTFENDTKIVRVYPNPTINGIFTVATDGFDDDTNVHIIVTNSNGQKIYEKKLNDPCHTDINLNGKLSDSIYFITIKSDQSKIVKKLIVK